MGPTPTRTPTLGTRLSCNFVNGYTIAYRVQYMYTCACPTDIVAEDVRVGPMEFQLYRTQLLLF